MHLTICHNDIGWTVMSPNDKPLVWLHGEVQTPPFSKTARLKQDICFVLCSGGEIILAAVPPDAFHWGALSELRIVDKNLNWRIVYLIEPDAIVILEVFERKTSRTPKPVTDVCKKRIKSES